MMSNYIIMAFMSCLVLSGVYGKTHETRGTKKLKTTTDLHRSRLKQAVMVEKKSNFDNARQHGGRIRQVLHGETKNTTSNLLKRTMKAGTAFVVKNMATSGPTKRPLRILRLKTASPFARSSLTSLRSSTFKPIHIYGSVPFKTFLTALSKSRGQETPVPTPALQSDVPQVAQSSSNVPVESPILQAKALQSRQLLPPGAMPVPLGPQGGVPVPGFGGAPLPGAMPMLPQGDMARFYNYPFRYHQHHDVHHLHHKGEFTDMPLKTGVRLISILCKLVSARIFAIAFF